MRRSPAILAALVFLAGCVAPPEPEMRFTEIKAEDCAGQAFVFLAMEDGMNGFGPDIRGARLAACRVVGATPDADSYARAYAEGAERYCGIENALRLGRNGIPVLRDCPAEQRVGFENSYAAGLAQRQVIAPLPHIGIGTGTGPIGQRWTFGPGMAL